MKKDAMKNKIPQISTEAVIIAMVSHISGVITGRMMGISGSDGKDGSRISLIAAHRLLCPALRWTSEGKTPSQKQPYRIQQPKGS